jgi:hypothetical protein
MTRSTRREPGEIRREAGFVGGVPALKPVTPLPRRFQ